MLERLLRSKAEVKVLGVVLFTDNLHLREIARRAGVSPYEAKKELETLVGLGILTKRKNGLQVIFGANKNCPFLHDLKNLYQKTEGNFSRLRQALTHTSIEYAFVFGSAASGEERPHSDIDVLIIGNMDEKEVADRIFEVQRDSDRAVNFILWSTDDLKEKLSKGSSFLLSVLGKKVVWLVGDAHEFGRAVKERPDKKDRGR